MTRTRIILADDHRIFMEGLKRLLEPEFDVILTVEDGQSLIDAANELRPDIVVADISMPKLNGIDAARQLVQAGWGVKIILLTMHEDVAYATTALDEGVCGYVMKHSAASDLLAAIRDALDGHLYVSPAIAREVFNARRRRTTSPARPLTPQQREILRLLVKGLTAKEIGLQLSVSRKTIEYHKYQIMEKLKLKTTANLIHYAITHGIAAA